MAEKAKKSGKRIFYEVAAPVTETKIHLYASSPDELVGKIIKLDMTRSLRGKSVELKLKIKKDDEKLNAEPISAEVIGSYIRRIMRKGADYVEDSFVTDCRDAKAIVKPFLITRNKVSRAVRKELRNRAKSHIQSYFKIRTASELFSDILTNKLQKDLSLKLKKIYPLALCEIRVFEVVEESSKI